MVGDELTSAAMKPAYLAIALGLSAALAAWVHWPSKQCALDLPPALSAEELAALPDHQVVTAAIAELRLSQAAEDPADRRDHLERMPEPARHILLLSQIVSDGAPRPPLFTGLAPLLQSEPRPSLERLAEAARAIGSDDLADSLEAAAAIAAVHPDGAPAAAYAELDARMMRHELPAAAPRLLTYVRAHLEDVAAARHR